MLTLRVWYVCLRTLRGLPAAAERRGTLRALASLLSEPSLSLSAVAVAGRSSRSGRRPLGLPASSLMD